MLQPFFVSLSKKQMKKCKLYQDISVGTGHGGDGCNLTDINVGIADGLYVFNRDDIQSLVFENDSRADNSLMVETINTNQPYYRIDATNISYQEEYGDNNYSHSLTASIKSVRTDIEEVLQEAVHGNYVIAFRVVGEDYYKLIGWKEGLSLDEVLDISSENNSYTLTLSGVTTYPHMSAEKENFNLAEKVFEPIFEPLFEAGKVVCNGGWAIAMYAVKVNAARQALDEDNKLVQYSGKPQDAYKLSTASDGGYHIVGTYNEDATFNGKSVKMYDDSLCNVNCSISISPSSLALNSTNTSSTISITSNGDWQLVSSPSTVSLSRTSGGVNDQTVWVYGEKFCGTETLTFKNKNGGCTDTVTITNNVIKIDPIYYYPNGTTSVTLKPIACCNYSVSSSEGTASVNADGSFTVNGIGAQESQKSIVVTLSCGSETKSAELVIYGINTSQGAKAISEFCEVE